MPGATASSLENGYVLCVPNGMYEDLTMIENFKRYNLTGREGLAFTLEIGRLAGFFIFPMDFVLHGRVATSGNTYTAQSEVRGDRTQFTSNGANTEVAIAFNPSQLALDLRPLPVWTELRTNQKTDTMFTAYRFMVGETFRNLHTSLLIPNVT